MAQDQQNEINVIKINKGYERLLTHAFKSMNDKGMGDYSLEI
ncbi:hypothetical protein [Vibrio sp. Of7-15]|nr:hypothetical protein [Vibrio sp. Of7-15]